MSLQNFWKFHFFAAVARIRIYAISLVVVCVLLLFTNGSVFAHAAQSTFSRTQLDFIPLESGDTIPPDIQNAMDQVPPDKMQAAQNAYELAKENPENVQVQTSTLNILPSTTSGIAPHVFIPGLGEVKVRVYAWEAGAVLIPYGFGLFFPLTTARNAQNVGNAAAAAITVAIITQYKSLGPFSAVIGAVIANILNSVPNYIVNVCQEQGGGFTVDLTNPIPVPYCGALPPYAL